MSEIDARNHDAIEGLSFNITYSGKCDCGVVTSFTGHNCPSLDKKFLGYKVDFPCMVCGEKYTATIVGLAIGEFEAHPVFEDEDD